VNRYPTWVSLSPPSLPLSLTLLSLSRVTGGGGEKPGLGRAGPRADTSAARSSPCAPGTPVGRRTCPEGAASLNRDRLHNTGMQERDTPTALIVEPAEWDGTAHRQRRRAERDDTSEARPAEVRARAGGGRRAPQDLVVLHVLVGEARGVRDARVDARDHRLRGARPAVARASSQTRPNGRRL
jgi:hypothetical protein